MSESNLPQGWAFVPLGELGEWSGGGTPSKSNSSFWSNGSIPWVSPKDMKVPVISSSIDYITEAAVRESATKLIGPGSILFVTRSGILAHTFPVARTAVAVTVNQDIKALTPAPPFDPGYVAWCARAYGWTILNQCSKDGTTVASVDTSRLHDFPFPIAPEREQHRIVEAIESYFTRLDDAVATLERVQRNLKRYRASVLKAAVEGRLVPTEAELARAEGRSYEPASVLLERVLAERRRRWEEAELAKMKAKGKAPKDDGWKAKYEEPVAPDTSELPELPEGWCWGSLPCLHGPDGFVSDGDWVESKDQDETGAFRLTQLQDVGDGVFRDRSRRFMNAEQVARLRCTLLQVGDVLVARMPDPLGRACVFPGLTARAVTAVDVCIVRTGAAGVDPIWLAHALNSPEVRAAIATLQSGSTRKRISRANLCSIPLPIPPLDEQFRIRQEADRLMSLIEELQHSLLVQTSRAGRLRQSILKWAFEGRLVDQDPTDEPASVLLERIRAERESAGGAPPKARRRRNRRAPKA